MSSYSSAILSSLPEYILYEVKIESTFEGIFNLLGEKHKWDSENGLYFDLGGTHL